MTGEQLSHESKIDAAMQQMIAAQPADRRSLQVEFYRLMSQRDPEVINDMELARLRSVGL